MSERKCNEITEYAKRLKNQGLSKHQVICRLKTVFGIKWDVAVTFA